MSSALTYLSWHELKGHMRPARVVPLLGLAMVASFLEVRAPWESSMTHPLGALSLFGSSWLPYMVPLAAAATGSSLAADRRRGLTLAVLARGVSRGQYLGAKVLGAMVSAGLIILAEIIGFYLMTSVMWPAGSVTWEGPDWYPGPVASLYAVNPLANDLLAASMSIAGAAALSLVGVLASTLVTNEYVAMATPPLFVILGAMLMPDALEALSPYVQLNVWSLYAGAIPAGMRPYAAFLYWLSLGTLAAGLSRWRFNQAELG